MTFEDAYYEPYFYYMGAIQNVLFSTCAFLAFSTDSSRVKSAFLLLAIYSIYAQVSDLIFGRISAIYYIMETIIFSFWTANIIIRTEYKTAKTIDNNNILLAFYKGKKGSFIMHFFELFGLPVKSMCILAGDKALYLKSNKETFEFGNSSKIHKKSNDYIVVDTGVPYTDEFVSKMREHINVVATRGILRIRCIEAVSDLLGMIGSEFKPKTYIPSLYLKGLINERR